MREYRDKGVQHPMEVNWDFVEITYMEDGGSDNDDVIVFAPSELPESSRVR
ncbi:MAG: hypothetical protein F6K08_06080 [Okeania sp. SIO1H6]|uniref:Uncharacterized protein n=1 Tax=Okeania hirsuta TaxID=1458930 RepID=A0A3N6PG38_9CYAN|nr:hypothetical protein [Okeania sp. SIO1H4]NES91077.1 hypothetical protein [Okeania sp. SIO2B9]NET12447.1 hypothetical protein [Okeania sp. SIO1H6]NET20381.1 hypothetical protein [Okeania sp. SIO1H5]NET77027.1 hypothetical protein [Okeania sp. SIO1F9]NET94647.1 hypothetical protein [Okeania sp. SIO1H2]RQH24851.1 hypothetical protein D4Z78_03910 [Okeania hirsuta]